MKLKGNYFWFFSLQLVSGIIAYPLMVKFGLFLGIFLVRFLLLRQIRIRYLSVLCLRF